MQFRENFLTVIVMIGVIDLASVLILNNREIPLTSYEEEKVNERHQISVTFNVTSEEYHGIATLLYEGTFDVQIPERNLKFRGTIQQYSTSITNLYEANQVGEYQLTLLEVKD